MESEMLKIFALITFLSGVLTINCGFFVSEKPNLNICLLGILMILGSIAISLGFFPWIIKIK